MVRLTEKGLLPVSELSFGPKNVRLASQCFFCSSAASLSVVEAPCG